MDCQLRSCSCSWRGNAEALAEAEHAHPLTGLWMAQLKALGLALLTVLLMEQWMAQLVEVEDLLVGSVEAALALCLW